MQRQRRNTTTVASQMTHLLFTGMCRFGGHPDLVDDMPDCTPCKHIRHLMAIPTSANVFNRRMKTVRKKENADDTSMTQTCGDQRAADVAFFVHNDPSV